MDARDEVSRAVEPFLSVVLVEPLERALEQVERE
jgi:hypothetical protein